MCTTCGCGHGETRIDGDPESAPSRHDMHEVGAAHAHPDAGVRVSTDGKPVWRRHVATSSPGLFAGGHPRLQGPGPAAGALGAVHAPGLSPARIVQIERDLLATNDASAAQNRQFFADRGIFALNFVSSPGSGKTSLLVRTIEELRDEFGIAVIEGDQQTSRDADRIRATGAQAVQINTGKGCHLDAHMVSRALPRLDLSDGTLVLIENVGNLVCPAAFDLGEAHKVAILSVTEGEDKPLKYPDMFHAADLLLINKIDLLPYVDFDVDAAIAYAHRVRPELAVIRLSATTGEGFPAWIEWLSHGAFNASNAHEDSVRAYRLPVAELV